ncbi:endonuclease-8 [Sediminihabitans luteus]|uniref:DNA-(apurinic or apyrimidinic site) lyase n=1 Tax=Sediminihabitans luteus TaxID=1138585 RepID=A0A2M9CY74_9CELL|nr:DNA-formamidopyrimidine glycosylase family protein [Sediminihabitans luteus]PJJ76825.1 endonuclease-8 [Sediminihabitans luteus]GIJ00304.1 formamidopyrimidine-DNA glycosylase [Sediminihabitans luteus]
MPEGHTVHRLARTFGELFAGQRLDVSSPQGRFEAGARRLDGRRLVAAEAWGKHLFLGFAEPAERDLTDHEPAERDLTDHGQAGSEPTWLRVHLGLYGAWTFAGDGSAEVVHAIGAPRRRVGERETVPDAGGVGRPDGTEPGDTVSDDTVSDGADAGLIMSDGAWSPPAPRGQVRVRLVGEHAVADLTGPTACEVVLADDKRAVEARLGPDPIRAAAAGERDAAADRERFVARVRRSRTAVGLQLMDQAVVAGVGNIYRAEVLFRAGLDPARPGRDVPADDLRALWDDLVVLMTDGARVGAIVTTRPADRRPAPAPAPGGSRRRVRQNTDATPGAVAAEDAFYVYHRDGLPCRVCGTTVLVRDAAGRTLYWCPRCQA